MDSSVLVGSGCDVDVDELGRCFVVNGKMLEDKWEKDEADTCMFSLWNKRSDVLAALHSDDSWRTIGPR